MAEKEFDKNKLAKLAENGSPEDKLLLKEELIKYFEQYDETAISFILNHNYLKYMEKETRKRLLEEAHLNIKDLNLNRFIECFLIAEELSSKDNFFKRVRLIEGILKHDYIEKKEYELIHELKKQVELIKILMKMALDNNDTVLYDEIDELKNEIMEKFDHNQFEDVEKISPLLSNLLSNIQKNKGLAYKMLLLAKIYEKEYNETKSLYYYDKALELNNEDWEILYEKCNYLAYSEKKYDEIMEILDHAIKKYPTIWKFWILKANVKCDHFYQNYDFKLAREFMNKAYELAPESEFKKLSSPKELKFHARIMKFLDFKPLISLKNLKQIEEKEKELDIVIPESIKEWYSLEGAWNLFRRFFGIYHIDDLNLDDDGLLAVLFDAGGGFVYKIKPWKQENDPLIADYLGSDDRSDEYPFSQEIFRNLFYLLINNYKELRFNTSPLEEYELDNVIHLFEKDSLHKEYDTLYFYNKNRSIIAEISIKMNWVLHYNDEKDLIDIIKKIFKIIPRISNARTVGSNKMSTEVKNLLEESKQ